MMDDLMDDDGENRAIRMFLAYYGGNSGISVFNMKYHLRMAGFDKAWPAWCDEPDEDKQHLTKAGAQLWIRHLIALEDQNGLRGVDAGPIEEWRDLIQRGCVSNKELLIMAKDAEKVVAQRKYLAELTVQNLGQCSNALRLLGKPYSRTCKECGITGPCKYPATAQSVKND